MFIGYTNYTGDKPERERVNESTQQREKRVFGPPGTGKTTTLSRYIGEVSEYYGSNSMVIGSFTKTAARELVAKMQEMFGQADYPIEHGCLGTLHSLCYRAIGRPGVAESHIKEWNEAFPQYGMTVTGAADPDDGVAARLDVQTGMPALQNAGDDLLNRANLLRARLVQRDLWPESVRAFMTAWEGWMYESDYVDFTGMIERAYKTTDSAPGYPLIGIFDEVQDFTPLELALVRRWSKQMKSVVLAGDDDQCIFRFTGATPDAFLDPPIPAEDKTVLSKSFRLPRAIQEYSLRWIEQVTRREPKEFRARDDEGAVVHLSPLHSLKNPHMILEDAKRYLDDGKTVMFLTSCGYMLDPIKRLLRDEGIPFWNPYRRTRGDWNPLRRGGEGTTSAHERLMAFLRALDVYYGQEARLWTCEEVGRWAVELQAKGVLRHGVKATFGSLEGREETVNDEFLRGVFEPDVLEAWGWDAGMGYCWDLSMEWYLAHMLPARAQVMEFPASVVKRYGVKALTEKPRVIIGTIHSVKGGEADVVYLFPDLSRAGCEEWLTAGEPRDSIIRVFYVGQTRARETLVICAPSSMYTVTLP